MKKNCFAVMLILCLAATTLYANGGQEASSGPRTVSIEVWTREGGINHWRADLAVEAAKELNAQLKAEGSQITVEAVPVLDEGDWGGYKKNTPLPQTPGRLR